MIERLTDCSIVHGGIRPVHHARLGVTVNGQTAISTMRFFRPVRLERVELHRDVTRCRKIPFHPARLTFSVLNRATHVWDTVRKVEIPPDPRIAGQGLSPEMTEAEENAFFEALGKEPPLVFELGGLETDHLRVECDREHPVWPSHMEHVGGVFNVPFRTLYNLRAYGTPGTKLPQRTPYAPLLHPGRIHPEAPRGMRIRDLPAMLLFEGRHLSVGFSLRRPLLMHLGWDAIGGQAGDNRLRATRSIYAGFPLLSGPLYRGLDGDIPAALWTGEVSVEGNRVAYRRLRAVEGFEVDAVFTVEKDRLLLELTQTCAASLPVIEAEAWRLAWDLTAGITGAAARPTLRPGRNGDVELPMVWATNGVGCLACRQTDGPPERVQFQVESYRQLNTVVGGFVLGERPGPDACQTLPAGTLSAGFEWRVANLAPKRRRGAAALTPGLRRHWATVFACFRPEHGGFSNHSASTNCHVNQHAPIEMAVHTARPKPGPDPLDLARFTIERALLDGGGYGYFRNLFLDSDPLLVSAAGRIHQARSSVPWLRRIEPGVREALARMTATIGDEGLALCRDLTGNSGSYKWSSNAMDVVGFGHMDAYINAWTYRALRNAAALLADLGDSVEAERCRRLASALRAAYARYLVNPRTGWVAGWKSRDGELHDFAFLWVNGVALAFGLLDPDAARSALDALEALREQVGLGSARLGLPCNLLPIKPEDQALTKIVGETTQTFETYTDGSLSAFPATYYLRALSIHGPRERARKLADELDEGYAAGVFSGGNGTGREFSSWEGLPTGYEGTLGACFGTLYAIAVERGVLAPGEPEWWPANG